MPLQLTKENAPATPVANVSSIYVDTADGILKRKADDGSIEVLSYDGRRGLDYLINREFAYAQRQVNTTLTTYSSTGLRVYTADRWSIVNENASTQFATVDSVSALETGLASRFYGQWKKISAQGKIEIFQVIESRDCHHMRGRQVRFSMKARNSVGTNVLKMAVLSCNVAGTADQGAGINISSHNAAGSDPTLGGSATYITPDSGGNSGVLTGNGVLCTLASGWLTFSGTWTIPSTALNVAVMIFTDSRPAISDIFMTAEASLMEKGGPPLYIPTPAELDRAACQRFYCKSFAEAVAPAQNAGVGGANTFFWAGAGSLTRLGPTIKFPVPMRSAAPTVTLFNPSANNALARDATTGTDAAATTVSSATAEQLVTSITAPAGWAAGEQIYIAWTADAEI
jgi:hypothetical protein